MTDRLNKLHTGYYERTLSAERRERVREYRTLSPRRTGTEGSTSLSGSFTNHVRMSFLPMFFNQECGFWHSQFEEVIDNLILLTDNIVCQRTRVMATKSLAILLMLRIFK